MLTPKNNLKQKLSAAMDKMREKKVARLENKVEKVKGKMQPKSIGNDSRQRAQDMYNSSKNGEGKPGVISFKKIINTTSKPNNVEGKSGMQPLTKSIQRTVTKTNINDLAKSYNKMSSKLKNK